MAGDVEATVTEAVLERLTHTALNNSCDVEDLAPRLHSVRMAHARPYRTGAGVVLTRFADIQPLMRDRRIVMTDPTGDMYKMTGVEHPLGPLNRDGEDHLRYRKLLDPAFAPQRVAAIAGPVRILADELIDQFVERGEVEFHDEFAVPLPSRTFLDLVGLPQNDLPRLLAMKDGIIRTGAHTAAEREERALAAGADLRAYLRAYLDDQEDDHATGLLGELLQVEQDGQRLSRDEVVDILHLFCLAGLDTVTSSLTCIVAWLARHPDDRRAVVADQSRWPALIEELLRLQTPVPASCRWATEDLEVNGFAIKAGERIHALWAVGNLDPDEFPKPLVVDPDRPANRHMAFATGFHRCLGSHLARLELRVALEEFHRRVPDYQVMPGSEPVWTYEGVRAAVRLPLVFRRG